MIDKSILALSYVVLLMHLTPLGTNVLAGFNAVREMEQFSFLPALAFAQIISLLVSNDVGSRRWNGIKSNIKKVLFMSICFVFSILAVCRYFHGRSFIFLISRMILLFLWFMCFLSLAFLFFLI